MSEHPENRALEIFSETSRYNRWIADRVRGALGDRVLEVGCGIGNLTGFFLDRELVVGIDLSAERIDRCRDRFAATDNARFLVCDISGEPGELADQEFDTVLCLHVLEHVVDDEAALESMRGLLPVGGRLALLVPRYEWLYCALDRSVGHQRRYAKHQIIEKLERHGFRVLESGDQNFFGLLGWLWSGKLLGRKLIQHGPVELFEKVFPVLRRIDDWTPFLPGLSIRIIAERSG